MAHFAKVLDGIVQAVIVVSNDSCGGGDFPDSEPIGQAFIADILKLDGKWLQTSYSGSFRSIYAGIGFSYDPISDIYLPPFSPPPVVIEP